MPRLIVAVALVVSAWAALGCANIPPLPPKAIELNDTGAAALAAGDLITAEARFELALEYSPRFTEAWVNRGLVELRREDKKQARKYFVKARELNPDMPAPHHALGLLADKRGLGSEAEAHYRQALKVDPGFVASRANLARRLFERAAFEEAREQFLRLTEVATDALEGYVGLSECLLRLDREEDADNVIGRARARFGDVPALLMLVGRQLLRREAFVEAESVFARLTDDAEPTRAAAAWAWIAVARLARFDRARAESAAREALALEQANSVALWVLEKK